MLCYVHHQDAYESRSHDEKKPGFEMIESLKRVLHAQDFKEQCRKKPTDFTRKRVLTFPVLVVFLVLLGLAVGVGLALLGTLGRAALVDQTQAAEDRGVVSLRDGWQAGQRHLWPVFFIRLLLGLPAGVVTLVGALPMLGTALLLAGQERPEMVIPGIVAIEFAFEPVEAYPAPELFS